LQLDLNASKSDNGRTVAEIATLTAGAAAASAAIKGKDDEINSLRLRINGLEAALKAKDTDLSGWNTRFMSLQGDFDSFKVTAKSNDDELAALRARIAILEDDLNKAVYARGTFEASLKARDLHVTDLQAELAKLRDADAGKSSQIATFMASVNSAGDAIKAREQELAEANARYAALDKSLNDAKWRIGELEAELGKVRGAAGDYEARLAALDKRANDALWRVGELESEVNKASGASSDYEARIAGLNKSLGDANARVGELEGLLSGKDKDTNDLRWRIGELEAELASLRAARMDLEGDVRTRDGRIGELEAELTELRARPVAPAMPAEPMTLLKADKSFAESAASEAGVEVVRSECPQHLSEIDGIGTVFEQRLFEYGIGTYFEVANLSDDEFRKALKLDEIAKASKTGSKMLKIDFDAIRKDALRLAKETGTLGRTWLGGHPDDFEPIDGIGHVYELRLYNAGICTYEALIQAGPARLAEICQPPSSKRPARLKAQVDYEGWIRQAIDLMNQKNKAASGSLEN
jgi:predicted flap endonuclease-1-like 5' DNA nuclease/peptidoglycan hydrolase CwlO-like protein